MSNLVNIFLVLGMDVDSPNKTVQLFSNIFGISPLTVFIVAQALGIVGLVIIVSSFQCKKNKSFFLMQGFGSMFFFLNFLLIGAFGGAFFNLVNLVRGLLFSKNREKLWKLITVNAAYILCFAFSIFLNPSAWQIFLVALPFSALFYMSILMYKGNDKHIRAFQIALMSPTWIFHNIFNLSIGGIVCEVFNMVSSAIYLLRNRKTK